MQVIHSHFFPTLMFAPFVFSQGLGAESKNLYPFLLPVIQLSTDVSQPPHVYLLEDGLELWYEAFNDHFLSSFTFVTQTTRVLFFAIFVINLTFYESTIVS